MKCRILSVDSENEKMRASFKIQSRMSNLNDLDQISPGIITEGTVANILAEGLIIQLPQYDIHGFLPKEHLSDNLSHITSLFEMVKEGDKFSEILILSKDVKRGQLKLSVKPWLLHGAKVRIVSSIQEVKVGMTIPGFVKNVTEKACFISFVGDLVAMAPLNGISDMFITNAADTFVVGQSVIAHITKVDSNEMRIFANLKESILIVSSGIRDFELIRLKSFMEDRAKIRNGSIKQKDRRESNEWGAHFLIGDYAEGTVKSIMPYGTILDMKSGGSGLITHYSKASYKQGVVVLGQVLDIDTSKKIVDLRLAGAIKKGLSPNLDSQNFAKVIHFYIQLRFQKP